MRLITNITQSITVALAQRPIHVIVIVAILASILYLSVVDEYLSETVNYSNSINYYHGPDNGQWSQVDDISRYKNADRLTLIPLKFSRSHNSELPEIENSFCGVNDNERFIIINSDRINDTLASLNNFQAHGTTWKFRNSNRFNVYMEYVTHIFERVKNLIQLAEGFDVTLITVAYLAMWYTLIKVFFDMRVKARSKFWLAFSTLVSSTFAFLFALVTTTKFLGVKVTLLSMTEGLPFLVAIIGFKHKVSIASIVVKNSTSKQDVNSIISNAISSHLLSLFRDHLAVIGALVTIIVYANHLQGLRNFSILAALILSYDLLMIFTFFASILTLKVEINRARRTKDLKQALEDDGISSWIADNVAEKEIDASESMFDEHYSILSFKVFMIAGFFGFQAFWLSSNWLYSASDNEVALTTLSLSKTVIKHVNIGPNGTLLTVVSTKRFVPLGFFVQLEDTLITLLELVSLSIRDHILSKLILLSFVISLSINIYFLNASRHQVSATNKLIENEIIRPKVAPATAIAPEIDSKAIDNGPEPDLIPLEEAIKVMKQGQTKSLANETIATLVSSGSLPLYALEKQLGDNKRAVVVRRQAIATLANAPVLNTNKLPVDGYDYDRVFGACCENVIGYMPLPVGIAGPLIIDGQSYHIPMATTEGCLVASALRGCKAMNAGGGVTTVLTQDGMTRGPCVQFPSLVRAGAAKIWIDSDDGQARIKKAFNSTSRFARLQHIKTAMAGTLLFIRFRTTTGDAMGMNMISKGVEYSLNYMIEECGFDDMEIISVSGNYCIDKKPAAINWIEGRGKSVVAEARVPAEVVKKVLKSDVKALVNLNVSKNLVGSAMAGSIGGFNAQAANLVTAIYLACGQDPAQNVESSNCITLMNELANGDLQISVSMPSIEVGTIGGGTILEPQAAMLELLGVKGPHATNPGDNARRLARIVASAVLAAELSLCSALAAGHLVQSHMQHNRKAAPAAAAPAAPVAVSAAPVATLPQPEIDRLKQGSITCIKS